MMKWFRKHNKQLLAVFASALLVIWLGGSALERMFAHNPFTEPVGTAMGHKINASQHGALKTKLNLMESLGLPWYAPWANQWVKQQFGNMNEQQAQMLMMTMGQPLSREKGRYRLVAAGPGSSQDGRDDLAAAGRGLPGQQGCHRHGPEPDPR